MPNACLARLQQSFRQLVAALPWDGIVARCLQSGFARAVLALVLVEERLAAHEGHSFFVLRLRGWGRSESLSQRAQPQTQEPVAAVAAPVAVPVVECRVRGTAAHKSLNIAGRA